MAATRQSKLLLSSMIETIYLARHGFRLSWESTIWQPVTGTPRDPPLSAHGCDQAVELAEWLSALPEEEKPVCLSCPSDGLVIAETTSVSSKPSSPPLCTAVSKPQLQQPKRLVPSPSTSSSESQSGIFPSVPTLPVSIRGHSRQPSSSSGFLSLRLRTNTRACCIRIGKAKA